MEKNRDEITVNEGKETRNKQTLAVLFAYNGANYDGLERIKEMSTTSVEQALFSAFPKTTTSLTHISRASLTNAGEHAKKQVISLTFVGDVLPTVQEIDRNLPDDITVFKIQPVSKDFSARRTCEARTVEYLIPTYAFRAPPDATHYCNKAEDENDQEYLNDSNSNAKGGLFDTKSNKHTSLDRRMTFMRKKSQSDIAKKDEDTDEITAASNGDGNEPEVTKKEVLKIGSKTYNTNPRAIPKKKTGFKLFIDNFLMMFKPKKHGSELLKKSLDVTLSRRATTGTSSPSQHAEENFSSTLRRSFSQKTKSVKEVLDKDILEREINSHNDQFGFEPLAIPPPTPSQIVELKSYRMSLKKYHTLLSTLEIFNGTHNFHNYIPGSVQDDSRCFVHIYNIEASPLEVRGDMEWLRIKVQANAFARDQIRRMMAMLIMVIRTNTPQSLVGNSFGFNKIDIPETPVGFQILDEVHYNNYNAGAKGVAGKQVVRFGDVKGAVDKFCKEKIDKEVFKKEANEMKYEEWIRELDSYSFMYSHFLNERGLITKPRNYPVVDDEVPPVPAGVPLMSKISADELKM